MCGIIHCKKTNKSEIAKKLVAKRYDKQSARGKEGFGFVEIKNGFVVGEIRTQTEKEILEHLEKSEADEIMFHHRYPTSTPNVIESTHPIKVSNPKLKYNYYVIHNGIISNDDDLKADHLTQGFYYTTAITKKWITTGNVYKSELFNDSEALAIDFALAIENNTEIKAKGSIAIIALQYEKETGKAISLYFGRNSGNPLCIEQDRNFFSLSSESGKQLDSDILYKLDYDTNEITEEKKRIGDYFDYKDWTGYDTTKTKWKDYTDHLDEDDFEIGDYEMIQELEDEISNAYMLGDYDTAFELESELEEVKLDMEAKSKRLDLF